MYYNSLIQAPRIETSGVGRDAGPRRDMDTNDLANLEDSARRASTLMKSMGNPHRLLILCQLVDGEKRVSELEKIVGLSQSALSQHLARLRRDNLVSTRRQAQTIFYSLAGQEARAVIETLYGLYCAAETQTVAAR